MGDLHAILLRSGDDAFTNFVLYSIVIMLISFALAKPLIILKNTIEYYFVTPKKQKELKKLTDEVCFSEYDKKRFVREISNYGRDFEIIADDLYDIFGDDWLTEIRQNGKFLDATNTLLESKYGKVTGFSERKIGYYHPNPKSIQQTDQLIELYRRVDENLRKVNPKARILIGGLWESKGKPLYNSDNIKNGIHVKNVYKIGTVSCSWCGGGGFYMNNPIVAEYCEQAKKEFDFEHDKSLEDRDKQFYETFSNFNKN